MSESVIDDGDLAGAQHARLLSAREAFLRRRRLIPAIIGASLFMQQLDSTIISNALPTMARALHESPLTLNLAITAYLLSAAIFLPISGWLADRFGARRVFMIAIVGFAVTSLGCGLAQNIEMIVVARFLQGVAGALMMPVGRLVLLKLSPRDQLVEALATLTMPALLGPILGPPVGGLIVTYADWRWIFFLNVPVAALGVVLVNLFIPEVKEQTVGALDIKGLLLSGFGLAAFVFGFQNVGERVLPLSFALALVIAGAILLTLYVRHARRAASPLLDLTMLRNASFAASVFGGFFPRLMIGAAPFLLALTLQLGFGLTAFAAGSLTFVAAVGALAMKVVAPPIIRRFGFKTVLMSVSVVTAIMMASYGLFTASTPHLVLGAVLLISGFFRSLLFTAVNAVGFVDMPNERMSRASALASVFQQLTQSVGISLAAMTVHVMLAVRGSEALTTDVIAPGYVVIAIITLGGMYFFARLPPKLGMAAERPVADAHRAEAE